jgi:hypothetical protein
LLYSLIIVGEGWWWWWRWRGERGGRDGKKKSKEKKKKEKKLKNKNRKALTRAIVVVFIVAGVDCKCELLMAWINKVYKIKWKGHPRSDKGSFELSLATSS